MQDEKSRALAEEGDSPIKEDEDISTTDKGDMSFLNHLEDLRGTLIRCIVALFIACFFVMGFLKYFASLLNWPLQIALGANAEEGLITTSPMAVFSVILQISFLGGFALSLPFILYFVARFVSPGLTEKELRALKPGCFLALVLFIIGALFSFFALVPASLKASIFFNHLFGFEVFWTADRYYGLLMWMVMGIGLSFEFPLIIVLLVYIGIIDTTQLQSFRPYSIIVFLVLAAVITPTTDPFTFLLLAVPMGFLYEMSLFISKRVESKKSAEMEDTETSAA